MTKLRTVAVFAAVLSAAVAPLPAAAAGPYAGEQTRDITSLSAADVTEIMAGAGWGLAKPAEFNGYPGPRHVLDLGRELKLDDAQKAAVSAVFEHMNAEARRVGNAYVEAERAIDQAFRSGRIDDGILAARLAEAGRLRDALRQVHLTAHLKTAPILTAEQRRLYGKLRGYGDTAVPGHEHTPGGHR